MANNISHIQINGEVLDIKDASAPRMMSGTLAVDESVTISAPFALIFFRDSDHDVTMYVWQQGLYTAVYDGGTNISRQQDDDAITITATDPDIYYAIIYKD